MRSRVIQCETVGAARPAIVSHDAELVVAQMSHDLELVTADRAHAVGFVVGSTGRLGAGAVPTQIGGDDGVALGEVGSYPMPHQMRFRNTVQEQQRRSVAASASVDRRTRGRDIELFESIEHGHEPPRDSRTVLSCRNWRAELTMNLSFPWPAQRPPACPRPAPPLVPAPPPPPPFA